MKNYLDNKKDFEDSDIEDALDGYIQYHNSTKKSFTRYIPNEIRDLDNADLIEPVNKLCVYVYDIRKYVAPRTRRDNGYYSGVNGLLPLISKYTKLLRDVQQNGGMDYQRKELDDAQKEMKNTINVIKDILTTYNIDLKNIKSENTNE